MQQILIGIILVLSFAGYYLYQENITLKANNKALQADFELQTQQMNELSLKSQAAQRELNRYTQFIQNYELSAKILADPVEMQRKINNGTKHIMENIEQISSDVDDLDDGLQLQSDTD